MTHAQRRSDLLILYIQLQNESFAEYIPKQSPKPAQRIYLRKWLFIIGSGFGLELLCFEHELSILLTQLERYTNDK